MLFPSLVGTLRLESIQAASSHLLSHYSTWDDAHRPSKDPPRRFLLLIAHDTWPHSTCGAPHVSTNGTIIHLTLANYSSEPTARKLQSPADLLSCVLPETQLQDNCVSPLGIFHLENCLYSYWAIFFYGDESKTSNSQRELQPIF